MPDTPSQGSSVGCCGPAAAGDVDRVDCADCIRCFKGPARPMRSGCAGADLDCADDADLDVHLLQNSAATHELDTVRQHGRRWIRRQVRVGDGDL